MKTIKIIRNAVMGILLLLLIPYLGVIVPEYTACNDALYEGQKGIDIWGTEVDCSGENRAFGAAFFQIVSWWLTAILIVWLVLHFCYLQ